MTGQGGAVAPPDPPSVLPLPAPYHVEIISRVLFHGQFLNFKHYDASPSYLALYSPIVNCMFITHWVKNVIDFKLKQ